MKIMISQFGVFQQKKMDKNVLNVSFCLFVC